MAFCPKDMQSTSPLSAFHPPRHKPFTSPVRNQDGRSHKAVRGTGRQRNLDSGGKKRQRAEDEDHLQCIRQLDQRRHWKRSPGEQNLANHHRQLIPPNLWTLVHTGLETSRSADLLLCLGRRMFHWPLLTSGRG